MSVPLPYDDSYLVAMYKAIRQSFRCLAEGTIGGVGRLVQDPINQAVDRLLKLSDEPCIRVFRSGLQIGNQGRFFEQALRPGFAIGKAA